MSDQKYLNKRRYKKFRSKGSVNTKSSAHSNQRKESFLMEKPDSNSNSNANANTNSNTTACIKFSQTYDSITNRNTPESSSFLNSSGISQLQKYMNATENDTIPIDASRKKASNLLRNKYKLIRNANRLVPLVNLNGKRLGSPESNQLNEIENEIENLFK
jgi:hypothetical protein